MKEEARLVDFMVSSHSRRVIRDSMASKNIITKRVVFDEQEVRLTSSRSSAYMIAQ